MRVRSMPRTASSVSRPSSEPGRFWVVAASVVRSSPVGAGSGPGGGTSANRVTAPALSATSAASTASPCCCAASGADTAASSSPRATWAAASAVDVASSTSACGRCSAIQPRVWAMPCGCEATRRTSARRVPGPRQQGELDGQHRLADDHQRRVVDQPVEHGGHGALDGVLDRHEPGVDRARAHRGEHRGAARARAPARRRPPRAAMRSACSVNVARGPRNADARTGHDPSEPAAASASSPRRPARGQRVGVDAAARRPAPARP